MFTNVESPKHRFPENLILLVEKWPKATLALAALVTLMPFIAKPFNIDDPLFLWAARHIQSHPGNPYDFTVNWYGYSAPMWTITKNPPLACYYLALSALAFGWNEIPLHCSFLFPAIMAILGTYRVARKLCGQPIFASLATLFMPVFLISSTSVMCDTTMLAFWVWAVAFWIEGMEKGDYAPLLLSAVLMTLATLTKYFGIVLIPLLAVYSFIKTRQAGMWAVYFVIPVTGLIAYEYITSELYGRGLIGDAGSYASQSNPFQFIQIPTCSLMALAFTGGCAAISVFLAPFLWSRKTLTLLVLTTVIAAFAIIYSGTFWMRFEDARVMHHGRIALQVAFWAIGGVTALSLAFADVWERRDADSFLLCLWVVGTFLFAGFVNWTVNGRSILPMAPAVAILLARRLARNGELTNGRVNNAVVLRSMAAAIFALFVARADYIFAQAARLGAETTTAKFGHGPHKLYYLGHWGWQYYMEQLGVSAFVPTEKAPSEGDIVAVSLCNANTQTDMSKVKLLEHFPVHDGQWIATLNPVAGAGFYSCVFGPLPFGFRRLPSDTVLIFTYQPGSPDTQSGHK